MANKRRNNLKAIIFIELLVIVLLVIVFIVVFTKDSKSDGPKATPTPIATPTPTISPTPTPEPTPTLTPEEEQRLKEEAEREARMQLIQPTLDKIEVLTLHYDYDSAINMIKEIEGYEKEEILVEELAKLEADKAKLVVWEDNTKITHIFVHSLIVDVEKAFSSRSSQPQGYNKYMTTIEEFRTMLDQMYANGFVLVSIHDIAKVTKGEDGKEKLVKNPILLPEGKKPFVLSQDDVNYYDYMKNDGFATRIVIGDDGKPTCEYIDDDGNVHYGEYDMVPIVDSFIEAHPDFSYHGAKGILAITGYEGALGYDTGWHQHDLDTEEGKAELKRLQEEATKVAECLKENGWEFASHSYTHTNMTNNSYEKLIYDTDKWEREVQPILGETDVYIYPFGADICDWRGYSGNKYEYLKQAGFWYFCNVDAAQYWIQIRDDYMRMGRINTDGERMYKTPEKLEFMFSVKDVFDKRRPVPVP